MRTIALAAALLMLTACADEAEPQLRQPIGDQQQRRPEAPRWDLGQPDAYMAQPKAPGAGGEAPPPMNDPPVEDPPPDEPPPDEPPPDEPPPDEPPPDEPPPDEPPPDEPPPDEPPPLAPDPQVNAGWIGGPCGVDEDCDYEEAFCLHEDEGYPRGMCSLGCERVCPDRGGMPVTFCIDELLADTGACVQRCDYDAFERGCRPGYYCDLRTRYGEPGVGRGVCVPGIAEAQAIDACFDMIDGRMLDYERQEPRLDTPAEHPDLQCIIDGPVRLSSPIGGVIYQYVEHDAPRPMLVSCHLASALARLSAILREYDIVQVGHIGTYNCRTIRGTDRLSQHSHGLAIDIRWFITSDGTMYDVVEHWEHDIVDWETGAAEEFETEAGRILFEIGWRMHDERVFNTVLTPDYNAGHDNHFHVDLIPGREYIGADGGWQGVFGPNTHGD